jgi:hypothetical protein
VLDGPVAAVALTGLRFGRLVMSFIPVVAISLEHATAKRRMESKASRDSQNGSLGAFSD